MLAYENSLKLISYAIFRQLFNNCEPIHCIKCVNKLVSHQTHITMQARARTPARDCNVAQNVIWRRWRDTHTHTHSSWKSFVFFGAAHRSSFCSLHRDCGEYVLIVNLIEVGLVCLAANKVRNARDTTKNAYLICLMVANSAICGWLATAAFCMHHECIHDGQNTRLGTCVRHRHFENRESKCIPARTQRINRDTFLRW